VLHAVNQQHCDASRLLAEGDEVGLFPPVSGGSGPELERLIIITMEPLDSARLTESVRHPSCGAVLTFEGVVREEGRSAAVIAIDYEAYPEMALRILREIRDEVEARHPGTRLALAHRMGRLLVGEPSVVVACAAAHRRDAFAACRLAMDRIKESLPVWKTEELAARSGPPS
jgi:molybdopterin synthase catalytic subunit